MDPIRKRELRRQAWMRLAAQRRRAGLLRGRVVVVSLLCFALLWGVLFAQMATGNDPVLAGKEEATRSRAVARARQKVETDGPRQLEPATGGENAKRVETAPEIEAEPAEEELVEEEPAEAEFTEEEFPEEEFFEPEPEPLVTSQS